MKFKLNIIIGSTRPGRSGPTIAGWLGAFGAARGKFDVEWVDLADVNLPPLDEANHPSQKN